MSHVVYGTSVKDVASKERLEKAFSVQLQEKKPVFYVLPSHKWLQTARKKQPGLLVTTFDDIASFILKQADETYLPLSEHERSLFFQQFMREEGFIKEGEHFGKAQGYADTYGQVKRLGLEVTELPPALDPLTSLFTNYEEKIVSARQLLDPENMILRAIALLEQAPASINIALVVIDGYFDFSPLQAMLIKALKHAAVPVELYVPNDESFSIVEETVAELGAIGFTDARERSHKQKLVGQKEIIAATTDEEQWRGVMEDICLSKLPLERIGVLVVDESMNALERYSSMYGLPLNHVRKRPLSTTAIYAFLLALLKLRQMPSSRWEQLPLVEHVLKLYFVRGLAYAKQKHSFLQASTWNRGEWERLFDYACSLIWERPKRLVTYLEQLRNWLVNLPVVPYWEQQFELETDVRLRQEMADEYKAWQELISQLERYKELLNEKGLSELTMSHDLFIEWVKERGDRLHLFKERASKGGARGFYVARCWTFFRREIVYHWHE